MSKEKCKNPKCENGYATWPDNVIGGRTTQTCPVCKGTGEQPLQKEKATDGSDTD